jgi:hypothetical protein
MATAMQAAARTLTAFRIVSCCDTPEIREAAQHSLDSVSVPL